MSTNPLPVDVDAVVCGGGPGGSTAASFLAKQGLSVLLLERERFPRFHIGESLLPFNLPVFERLGFMEKLKASGPQVKYGARFYHQGTEMTRFVKFARAMDGSPASAFQVKRADFDKLLLDHARGLGATVHEEARVEDVLFEGERACGVMVKLKGDTEARRVKARVVIDATGRDALLSRRLGGRVKDVELDRSAAFAHYSGFRRAEGPEGGDIVIFTTPDGWWWLIPFSDGSVSVGIVMPSSSFKTRTGTVERLFEDRVASTPEVKALLDGFSRLGEIRAIPDYSYTTPRFAGDGFCLVGDAACFLDPVFSTGVLLAMTSGEMAANAVARALKTKGRVDGQDFREMERYYRGAISRFSSFVHAFYKPHMLETFYTPAPNGRIESAVTTILAGGVFTPSLKARLWTLAFHACTGIVWVKQRLQGRGAFERATGIVVPEKTAA